MDFIVTHAGFSSSKAPSSAAADSTHFGFAQVPLGQKQGRVNEVFHAVADRYDLMNDAMSAGLHRAWKAALIAMANPAALGAFHHLDVAGGTGDIAMKMLNAGAHGRATLLDINGDMLRVGQARVSERGLAERIKIVQGNAEDLPFPDGHFDLYTIAFGIRNVPRIDRALQEAYRVLKPGGRFLCLEFSRVDVPLLDRLYETYSFHVIPPMGQLLAGDGEPYRYLVESIRKFPDQDRFAQMIKTAGFSRVSYRNFTGGVAAIHSGWRI